jgi:hypothetical protein
MDVPWSEALILEELHYLLQGALFFDVHTITYLFLAIIPIINHLEFQYFVVTQWLGSIAL